MSADSVTNEATAKVILLGEHSVVYGEPAIAAAIDRRLRVTVRRCRPAAGGDPALLEAMARAAAPFGLDPDGLRLDVESEIPQGAGLGSSAALSVALVRALGELAGEPSPAVETVVARASEVENVFHGTASGVDVAAVAHGGAILFRRGGPAPVRLRIGAPVELVVALSGDPRSTGGPVGRLRRRAASHPELYRRLFAVAGELVVRGSEAIAAADWATLGALFDAAQGLLNAFGVSTPTLERMVASARAAGALGAKLTGAGGGGAIVALAPGRTREVAAALAAEGFETFTTSVAGGDASRPAPVGGPDTAADGGTKSREAVLAIGGE